MDTSKESEKKLHIGGSKTHEIHWSFTAVCFCLFLCIFHFETSLLNARKKEINTWVEYILILF